MNTIKQAREVSARLHLGASIVNGRNIDKDFAVIAKAAGNIIDALIEELASATTSSNEWESMYREVCAKADAELAALKAQEPVCFVNGDNLQGFTLGALGQVECGQECVSRPVALYLAAGAQTKQVLEKLDELRVYESMFESWFSEYSPANKGTKQQMRDAYDAGMGDHLVAAVGSQQTKRKLAIDVARKLLSDLEDSPSYESDLALVIETISSGAQPVQQEPVAVHQFRIPFCSDWHDGLPDQYDGHGPYEERTLYAPPVQAPACASKTDDPDMQADSTIKPDAQERKPEECANGCPDRQVCDYCQGTGGKDKQERKPLTVTKIKATFSKLYPKDLPLIELAENNRDFRMDAIGAQHHLTAFNLGVKAAEEFHGIKEQP